MAVSQTAVVISVHGHEVPPSSRWVSVSPPPCTWWRCKRGAAGSQRSHPWSPAGQTEPQEGCPEATPGRPAHPPGTAGSGSGTSRTGRPWRTSPWRRGAAAWEHLAAGPSTGGRQQEWQETRETNKSCPNLGFWFSFCLLWVDFFSSLIRFHLDSWCFSVNSGLLEVLFLLLPAECWFFFPLRILTSEWMFFLLNSDSDFSLCRQWTSSFCCRFRFVTGRPVLTDLGCPENLRL